MREYTVLGGCLITRTVLASSKACIANLMCSGNEFQFLLSC